MSDGLDIRIDTKELLQLGKRSLAMTKLTKPAIAISLNDVGDGLVATMTTTLSKTTGLSLEQVRGMIAVSRANRNKLGYEVTIKEGLFDPKTARTMEGRRESGDFGKRQPGDLVIVVTAKDELVCMDCQELEAAGPMPVEIALQHVPKHPHCRCVIMPYVAKGRRLPVTMTKMTGSLPEGRPMDEDLTLRQLAQSILDRSESRIRVELK